MEDVLRRIRKDVEEGHTDEALKKAISLAEKKAYKSQLNHLRILSAQFRDFQRAHLGGLTNDRAVKNRIDLAILTLIDSIERINQPLSKSKKKEEFIGKVIYLNNEQHFGFIKSVDLANTIFFHFSSIKGNKAPRIKQKVYFELDKNFKGWYAPSMRLIMPPKKRKRLSKDKRNQRTNNLKKKMFENDIKIFFKRVEEFIIKLLNKIL